MYIVTNLAKQYDYFDNLFLKTFENNTKLYAKAKKVRLPNQSTTLTYGEPANAIPLQEYANYQLLYADMTKPLETMQDDIVKAILAFAKEAAVKVDQLIQAVSSKPEEVTVTDMTDNLKLIITKYQDINPIDQTKEVWGVVAYRFSFAAGK